MSNTRIYEVIDNSHGVGRRRLVEAKSKSEALAHVLKGKAEVCAEVPDPKRVVELMKEGVEVEKAAS